MTFKQMVLLYLITLVVFSLIDMVWLGAVVDLAWGACLGGLVSLVSVLAARRLFRF
jgi:uncharacterized membrane protein